MKEFIQEVSNLKNIKRIDLIEKDILLQKILLDLSKDDFFSKNLAFKGGTCLIKCYLGYYRFSEDIDFTWIDQSIFRDRSQKEIREIISNLNDEIGNLLVKVSRDKGMDFVLDKNNRKYFEFGGGNKTITFKLWYDSEVLKEPSFIKTQINFVENIKFDVSKRKINNLLGNTRNKNFVSLYGQDYTDYVNDALLYTYDKKEILCEKARAILTRRGIKARDFVDIYLITNKFGIKIQDLEDEIVEKTNFILNLYEKYRLNFGEKLKLLNSNDFFRWGTERELLLKDIDEKQFNRFVMELQNFLGN
jgi:predicted nucleotidyltransferase component of viral defense system